MFATNYTEFFFLISYNFISENDIEFTGVPSNLLNDQ